MQRFMYWVQTHKLMSFAIAFGVGAVIIVYLRSRSGTSDMAGATGAVGATGDSDPYGQGGNTRYFVFLPPDPTGAGVTGPQVPSSNVGAGGPPPSIPNVGSASPTTPSTAVPAGVAIGNAARLAQKDTTLARSDAGKAFAYQPKPVGQTIGNAIGTAVRGYHPPARVPGTAYKPPASLTQKHPTSMWWTTPRFTINTVSTWSPARRGIQ